MLLQTSTSTNKAINKAKIPTIKKNMEGYTKREVMRAINARDAQATMEYLSEADLKTEVSRKILVLLLSLVLTLLTQNVSTDQPTNASGGR